MKKLLPLLLAYAFLTTQSWALSGGPVFQNGDTGVTIGTYAGVLTPNSDQFAVGAGIDVTNSLGVFALGVPQIGLASGSFVYFSTGKTYVGTIVGIADPDRLTFQGLVKAQFNVDVNFGATTTAGTTAQVSLSFPAGYASGSIDCDIRPGGIGQVSSSLDLATRIRGTSTLAVQDADATTGQPTGAITSLTLSVDGYKQSSTADISADLTAFGLTQTLTGGSSGSGG